jgi:hypothetical protein
MNWKKIWQETVLVEWSLLLLRVQEVTGLNLGPDTGYPD